MHSNSNSNSSSDKHSAEESKHAFVLTGPDGKALNFAEISSSESESDDVAIKNDKVLISSVELKNGSGISLRTETPFFDFSSIKNEISINDLFEKENSNKTLKIDCTNDLYGFILSEYLSNKFKAPVYDALRKEVDSCLEEEASSVKLNFIIAKKEKTMQEKLQDIQNKRHSVLEDAKLLFNKVTLDKVPLFTKELKELKFETIDEMKELASFVFGKVIAEKNFVATYTKMVYLLKKDFKCEEEKALNKEQTCFFGTLLKLMYKKINEKHNFNQSKVLTRDNKKEAEIEAEIENAELVRKTKRNQALGAIAFCVRMYIDTVTGVANVKKAVDILTQTSSGENVELVCEILNLGAVYLNVKHKELVKSAFNFVKENNKFGPRIEIIVEQTEEKLHVLAADENSTKPGNSFASMFSVRKSAAPKKEVEKTEDQKIVEYFDKEVLPDISSCHDAYDLDDVKDVIYNGLKKFDPSKFMFNFFVFAVTEYKNGKKLCDMYSLILKDDIKEVFTPLQKVRQDLTMHYIDYPNSKIQYPEMLCHVLSTGNITREQFNELQVPDYENKIKELVHKWQGEGDERLQRIFTESEIEKITM
ncbi:hypothetical protein EHP00_2163 [Ecytonucleospora hepatopenaei]|uniref:Uncharacterized protein n=1 Tax=Ecytonucleospora hepatopenaei TaxID=646526 RepID=A0A1W0E579_9MICR|nr:hypothetical protein EHP00_2163 [Ecytonucleospora hepatopenaei]